MSNENTIGTSQIDAIRKYQETNGPLLEVKDLQVDFTSDKGHTVHAVRDASFTVYPGQWVAIVGESGSGKSTSAMAVLGLLPGTGKVTGGSIKLGGEELSKLNRKQYEKIRGSRMGLVPQDPMSNLNPVWRIGSQVKEALTANNMDIAHEKRSALAEALVAEDVDLKGKDDETFLGSKELPALIDAAKAAVEKAGNADVEGCMEHFRSEWVPGSETRWRVAEDLIKAGVDHDEAWSIAKQYVIGSTMNDRIAGLLSEAGLPDAATRARQFPHEFSGGMRQRALIAIGLASRPDLLIADEPTSALDVTVQKKILDHLRMLTDSLGTAVLFITHDLGLAAERAQHIVVMYKGQVVESGPSLEVLQHPQHPYTKRLVAAAPSLASQRIISAKERGQDATALMEHRVKGEETLEKSEHIITVDHLTKEFKLPRRQEMFKAVDDVSFSVKRGTTLAIVGESGSGKSVFTKTFVGMLDVNGKITGGSIMYEGRDMTKFTEKDWLGVRGKKISMVMQDPMTSLNPLKKIGKQIQESIEHHQGLKGEAAKKAAIEMLGKVGIPDPERRYEQYPHEFSGGMRQRVVIAIAAACKPQVLICDEPTTALDVTIQAQILQLIRELQKELGMSVIYITHDLGVVANVADRVAVMYAGQIVEYGTVEEIFYDAWHPYTWALLQALPQLGVKGEQLPAIDGTPPNLFNDIHGDAFAPRNKKALAIDFVKEPPFFEVSPTHAAKTWYLDPRAPKIERPHSIQNLRKKMMEDHANG